MVVIHADLLLGFNMILDWTLLRMTAKIRGIVFSQLRIVGGTVLGTAYAIVLFIPSYPVLYTYVGKILLSIIMIILVFGFHNIKYFLKNIAVFYFSVFTMAGGVFGLQHLLQDARVWALSRNATQWIDVHHSSFRVGAGFLITALPLSYVLFRFIWRLHVRQQQVARQLVQVDIYMGDTVRNCTGLVDTGNHLHDPLGGAPVVVTECQLWEGILPSGWLKRLHKEPTFDMLQLWEKEEKGVIIDEARLRLIPYRSINGDMQWMIGLRPDYVRIGTECITYLCKKVIIGLDGGTLSNDGSFQAIVHPDLLEPAATAAALPIPNPMAHHVSSCSPSN